jgi:hypothetical protein
MRQSNKVALVAALAIAWSTTAPARADDPPTGVPNAYAGAQLLVISGVHRDSGVNQYGLGAGPLVQARAGGRGLAVHLEGIPVVSIPARPSAKYGQATPSLGIVNSEIEVAVDPRARLWAGAGMSLYNQRTPLPAISQVVSSRLIGVRYALRYRSPLHDRQFVEGTIGASPTITGTDHYLYSDGVTPAVNKDERASEIDASLAFGIRRGSSEWLLGVRTLNFSAHFVKDGSPADRNVGTGLLFEWRHVIRQ